MLYCDGQMIINQVIDWQAVRYELNNNILSLQSPRARMDLTKILKGIEEMVSRLSSEEVECRRMHKQTIKHFELVAAINERIEFLEQMITFGALAT
jgi:hypothetical protein